MSQWGNLYHETNYLSFDLAQMFSERQLVLLSSQGFLHLYVRAAYRPSHC